MEPSRPPGDGPCPQCGCLVWFGKPSSFSRSSARKLWERLDQLKADNIAANQLWKRCLQQLLGSEPTPEYAAQVAEKVRRLLDGLNEELRLVAVAKMVGSGNAEIATRFEVTERTVARRLRVIRSLWRRECTE